MSCSRRYPSTANGIIREIDRKKTSISEEEAARIVGYFDKDGDGLLAYHEFMTMLQATKTSVFTKFLDSKPYEQELQERGQRFAHGRMLEC